MNLSATYSPDDNKLRLYAVTRLDAETYERVRAAGFKWAPKQELFVAPAWTPGREDLLIDLCGEIGDEDTSLVERAEQRADRFEDYSDRRAQDAAAARKTVATIMDGIPLGQPILVGHHSERRARKDAQRIEDGMRRAVKLWDTSTYWQSRAAGAIRAAKYKERPDVRHRRIKGLESDKRKAERTKAEAEAYQRAWSREDLTHEQALTLANGGHISRPFPVAQYPRPEGASSYEGEMSLWTAMTNGIITHTQARDIALPVYARSIERNSRWIAHYENRLAYERAMLAEQIGATVASDAPATALMGCRFDLQPGGRVMARRERDWLTILRVTRKDGVPVSVTTQAPRGVTWRGGWKYGVEEITDYEAPTPAEAEATKAATKLPPLCNFPGDGFIQMTEADWKRKPKDYRIVRTAKATDQHGAYRYREAFVSGGSFRTAPIYITDAKRKDPPPPAAGAAPTLPPPRPALVASVPTQEPPPARQDSAADDFEAMRASLKSGVQVVAAPQLFPTPAAIAAQMVEAAEIEDRHAVLEPSAGTGALLDALSAAGLDPVITAVEVNPRLANLLAERFCDVREGDFLTMDAAALGRFDRILMNPPFANGQDIAHITHAASLLKKGGRLVALCANGPRQAEKLRPLATVWEALPAGSFREQGTNVNVALLVIEA